MKELHSQDSWAGGGASVVLALVLMVAWPAPPGRADQAASEVSIGQAAQIAGGGGGGGGASGLSFFSLQTLRPAEYGGVVSTLVGALLTDNGATWADDQFNGANGPHYVEFASGLTVGITDTSGADQSLTLATPPAGVIVGDSYRIRQHWTVADVFGANNETGLLAGATAAEADNIILHDPVTQAATVLFYSNAPGAEGWRRSDGSEAAAQVIAPGQGMMLHRRAVGELLVFTSGVAVAGAGTPTVGLGSLVWDDNYDSLPARKDGQWQAGEPGIGGVTVQLFRVDPDDNPIDEVAGDALTRYRETTTGAEGTYLFTGLPEWRYKVRIPVENFQGGGPLVPHSGSSPVRIAVDNHVDGDNNGLQPGGGDTEVWSPVIELTVGYEPTDAGGVHGLEYGPGATQDLPGATSSLADVNADMTVDFGFWEPPTAARLLSFVATWSGPGQVVLTWQTGVEWDLIGFQVERATAEGGWVRVNQGLIPALGGSVPNAYRTEESHVPMTGPARYRLASVDLWGNEVVLAEAVAEGAFATGIRWSGAGVELTVRGTATAEVVLETATDLKGVWVSIQRLTLNDAGSGMTELPWSPVEVTRFYRVRIANLEVH